MRTRLLRYFHLRRTPARVLVRSSFATLLALSASCGPHSGPQAGGSSGVPAPVATDCGRVCPPDFLPDPVEPVNRALWGFNRRLLVGVMLPTGRAYRSVATPPVRRSVADFTRNLTYPGRFVNHLLQGRLKGAGQETARFVCNTTFGVAGVFDVASRWGMPKSEADFGQTFTRWGWKPDAYVMLPFLGPSDDCHAAGIVADKASEPWTYSLPYVFGSYASTYNRLTDLTEEAVRFTQSEADPYAGMKYAWSYASRDGEPDWSTHGPVDPATLQTLGVAAITTRDANFASDGEEHAVRMSATGRMLKATCWLRPQRAPLVYIAPGLGSHRLSLTALSMAECLYNAGYSVCVVSSIFHPEFMEHASTSDLPAYPPRDAADLLSALTDIDRDLVRSHAAGFGRRALVGCSMGAFQAAYLSAREDAAARGSVRIDRYVAVDTPVSLLKGVACLDGFYNAPMVWPAAIRQQRINNSIHKGAKLVGFEAKPGTLPPFDGVESRFLIGMTFRLTLRDALFSSQSRHNLGVLREPLDDWRREPAYREIMHCSYRDYFFRFVVPYYRHFGVGVGDFAREGDLRSYEDRLRAQEKLRVIVNRNDFLLVGGDEEWLRSTLGRRLTVFPGGGHLGNLSSPEVQKALVGALGGLK